MRVLKFGFISYTLKSDVKKVSDLSNLPESDSIVRGTDWSGVKYSISLSQNRVRTFHSLLFLSWCYRFA